MLAICYEDIYCTVILHSVARQGCHASSCLTRDYLYTRSADRFMIIWQHEHTTPSCDIRPGK